MLSVDGWVERYMAKINSKAKGARGESGKFIGGGSK